MLSPPCVQPEHDGLGGGLLTLQVRVCGACDERGGMWSVPCQASFCVS